MRNQSVNYKNSWQDNSKLKIIEQRKLIEFLVKQKINYESKLSVKLINFLKKYF